jgi:hypothetical protein
MDNFTFHNPTKVLFGKKSIGLIGNEICKECGPDKNNKVLLLAGGGSIKQNGTYQQVVESLKQHEIDFVEFWGVRPNPTLEHAILARQFAYDNNVNIILAVGGGSVIDEAKAIAASFYINNIWDLFENKVQIQKALPIFVVLTLSATGSEMNPFAVLSNEEELKKWAFGNPLVYPKATIIDPMVQLSLPKRQTANGGVDSLSHLMENYFMGTDAEVTIALNESVQRTVISQIDKLMENPDDYIARANLAWSSTIALNGITAVSMGGGEWTTHGLEHALSALKPTVAHAEGLAVLFPAWIKYVYIEKPFIFERWAKNVWNSTTVLEAIDKMKQKFADWGSPITLRELGFSKSDFTDIINNVNNYGRVGKIKRLSADDFKNILEIAY